MIASFGSMRLHEKPQDPEHNARTVQKSFLVYTESGPALRIARADERHGVRLSSTDQDEAPGHQGRIHVGHMCRPVTRARVREDCVVGRGSGQVSGNKIPQNLSISVC